MADIEAPPPQEGESVDPLPDSSAASGNHQAEAEAAGAAIESDFILDTGAPVHATGDQGLLSGARDLGPGDASVSLTKRNREILWATSSGHVQIGTGFYLEEVHYFPGLPPASTLVSVPQLTRRGFSVSFSGLACSVLDGTTVIGEGRLRDDDGFYHLDYLRVPII